MSYHAVVFTLGYDLLFKSSQGHCRVGFRFEFQVQSPKGPKNIFNFDIQSKLTTYFEPVQNNLNQLKVPPNYDK